MNTKINTLAELSNIIKFLPEEVKINAYQRNNWFTTTNIDYCINHWSNILNEDGIKQWLGNYTIKDNSNKNLGIVCAGNIPLVGLHDVLCGYVSGYNVKVKLSSSDEVLMKFVIDNILKISGENGIQIVKKFDRNIDFVIATGSNNTFRYFEYYFKDIPSILRRNRTSIAILDGKETDIELEKLADDCFLYYGLGCRNVSKIYLPKGYDIDKIFKAFYHYKDMMNHNKYMNNYEYNRAIFMLDNVKFLENGFVILVENKNFFCPLSVINYEYYSEIKGLENKVKDNNIQCIVSSNFGFDSVMFGETQKPFLNTYADNVDTMKMINN